MTMLDARDLPITNVSEAERDVFENALGQFQTYTGDPVATIDGALAARPDFVLGHVMRAYLMLTATEKGLAAEVNKSLDAAEQASKDATERERMHLVAAQRWAAGDIEGASSQLFDITVQHPRDALALQVGHLSDFYLGNAGMLRDRVASALPAWDADVPGFHAVIGMQAFGLEECGAYRAAEEAGRRAVELNPKDSWAIHAVAHVLEMEGRHQDGIGWMGTRVPDWSEDNFFAVHNWWHWALYHLDLGQTEKVLQFYDAHIRVGRSEVVLDMLDASALLWRLNLLGVDVGNRWQELSDCWAPLADDGFYSFNDAHAMMAFVGAGRDDLAKTNLSRLETVATGSGTNAMMARDVGVPVVKAISAFGAARYDDAVEALLSVRYIANRFGGSNAQRDILAWTLVEAALRAGRFDLADSLCNQRLAQKSTSLQSWQMAARAHTGLDHGDAAARAQKKVDSIRSASG
jgi:tetratricopeptide (TPR) repeat protein